VSCDISLSSLFLCLFFYLICVSYKRPSFFIYVHVTLETWHIAMRSRENVASWGKQCHCIVWTQKIERANSSLRAKVEHPFRGHSKCNSGFARCAFYRGLATKNTHAFEYVVLRWPISGWPRAI